MRLNRKDRNNDSNAPSEKVIEEPKKAVEEDIKPETKENTDEDQPTFAPRRMNLRNRTQKKEESYLPSMEKPKDPEPPKEEPKKEEYVPKMSFKN